VVPRFLGLFSKPQPHSYQIFPLGTAKKNAESTVDYIKFSFGNNKKKAADHQPPLGKKSFR